MLKIEVTTARIGNKWVAFKDKADLSELPPDKLTKWEMETSSCDTGSLIRVGAKIDVPTSSAAYPLAYSVAFAQIHLLSVSGPIPSDGKPSKDYLETKLPLAILTAYVNRADTSRAMTEDEYKDLQSPLETGETT